MKRLQYCIWVFLAVLRSATRFKGFRYRPKLMIVSVVLSALFFSSIGSLPILSQETPRPVNWQEMVTLIEQTWEKDYENYFDRDLAQVSLNADDIAEILSNIANQTGTKPAVLWAKPMPEHLKLVLLTPGDQPTGHLLEEVNPEKLMRVVQKLYLEVTDLRRVGTTSYLQPAQQLYKWIIQPFETTLEAEGIDTLLFCFGKGLRTLPVAALHDGEQFLIEKYSLTRIPAFNLLVATDYDNIQEGNVLAMGASEFEKLNPLPAVPVELSSIVQAEAGKALVENISGDWLGKSFLNQTFTLQNLNTQLSKTSFDIIHLATHAEFKPGKPSNSYIQFWDTQLGLDQMNQMQWDNPPAELLVLSACKTAVGDQDVELGFAGLALQSGVKSALASLWYVSDTGTLALMKEFYQQLKTAPTKADALRQAQIAMIDQNVRLEQGQLLVSTGGVTLPSDLANLGDQELSHPFYWAGFTLIGTPW